MSSLYKLVIVGDGGALCSPVAVTSFLWLTPPSPGVGKSALTIQLTQNHFVHEYGKFLRPSSSSFDPTHFPPSLLQTPQLKTLIASK